MLKAQISIEFLVIMGFLMTLLLVFAVAILKSHQDIEGDKEYVIIRDIAYKIKDEINLAQNVNPIYMRNFTIPTIVEGVNYSVNVTGNVVIVLAEHQEFSVIVPTVIGCIHKGNNSVKKFKNNTVIFQCI